MVACQLTASATITCTNNVSAWDLTFRHRTPCNVHIVCALSLDYMRMCYTSFFLWMTIWYLAWNISSPKSYFLQYPICLLSVLLSVYSRNVFSWQVVPVVVTEFPTVITYNNFTKFNCASHLKSDRMRFMLLSEAQFEIQKSRHR